ncbi:MAG: TIGR04282 family arsenosugar biosynthesis glycosyltransferase [Bacteroidota bacterium]|nr:TIGR04282 family arsenosugar biosynthesis glycosyltransferase [Bacteroidota bacterium]
MPGNALIIFQKNIEKGKVKTRLAETIGEDKALEVFTFLVNYTYEVATGTDAQKFLFLSERVDPVKKDSCNNYIFLKQEGENLGERMFNAFKLTFAAGFENVIIIGTDCHLLTAEILNSAFKHLKESDYVIGPAEDGGYYLLGMKNPDKTLFENKQWSTESVFQNTLQDITIQGKTAFLLPILTDVDTEKDLGVLKQML